MLILYILLIKRREYVLDRNYLYIILALMLKMFEDNFGEVSSGDLRRFLDKALEEFFEFGSTLAFNLSNDLLEQFIRLTLRT